MARDIYAHVPPFGEAKVWDEADYKYKEKEAAEMKERESLLINAGVQDIKERTVVVKQVQLHGWYTREELIKIASMKEMQ